MLTDKAQTEIVDFGEISITPIRDDNNSWRKKTRAFDESEVYGEADTDDGWMNITDMSSEQTLRCDRQRLCSSPWGPLSTLTEWLNWTELLKCKMQIATYYKLFLNIYLSAILCQHIDF